MKILIATFQIDNDLAEYQLRNQLEYLDAKYIKTLPNSDFLKEDTHYKELVNQKKQAEINLYKYIDSKR